MCPFPGCGRRFNVNSNMRRHLRNHTSPARPLGFTNDVPMSTDTPVMYCPCVATASEPSVSVSDMMSPPWTVCGGGHEPDVGQE